MYDIQQFLPKKTKKIRGYDIIYFVLFPFYTILKFILLKVKLKKLKYHITVVSVCLIQRQIHIL
jgi:hypothetical protein